MGDELNTSRSLESLRKEAKRWFKALQGNVQSARDRLERALSTVPQSPTLRDVQHALAVEYGFSGWTELKSTRVSPQSRQTPADALADWFLANACPDHHVRGASAHVRARATAIRILAQYPEVAHHDFYTSVVCGDVERVERELLASSTLANAHNGIADARQTGGGSGNDWLGRAGPKGWGPLLYLCFTRLDLACSIDNAESTARALLKCDANANAFFMAGGSRYTPLVGVIGEGEEDRPPHPKRNELVKLLLDAGADPFDSQVFYNMHFKADYVWYLDLIHEHTVRGGREDVWRDPEWSMIDEGGYGLGARFLLSAAIMRNNTELATWILLHGANPDPAPAPMRKGKERSRWQTPMHELALRAGAMRIAELLVQHGAARLKVDLSPAERLAISVVSGDLNTVRTMALEQPDLLNQPEAMFAAVREDMPDVIDMLVDLGMSPDVSNAQGKTGLHEASYENRPRAAKRLLARGARVDPVSKEWNNTPLGAAIYARHAEMIDLLAPVSRDIWELTFVGKVERVQELLAEDPSLARVTGGGQTPLMWLPMDDESNAIVLAKLYLANGADTSVMNQDGHTAADRADRMGMEKLASVLRGTEDTATAITLARYEEMAHALLDAYRTGADEAMRRHWSMTWHRRSWEAMRQYVLVDLGRTSPIDGSFVDISIDDAKWLVARENGFEDWDKLAAFVGTAPAAMLLVSKPLRVSTRRTSKGERVLTESRDWSAVLDVMRHSADPVGLHAEGVMTDPMLRDVATLSNVTFLKVTGSGAITDEGVHALAAMPQLTHLDLSGTAVTDVGLAVLRQLPNLERLMLSMTNITDAGMHHMAACDRLKNVNLMWTATGDAAIRVLANKPDLRKLWTGNEVTNAGMRNLHDIPAFEEWEGGDIGLGLLDNQSQPTHLSLRGSFDDRGMQALRGLNGLFGLDIGDEHISVTPAGLAPLADLAHLGWLSVDANDETMSYVAALPHLRFLSCQDTSAGNAGFRALSASQSIEYIWGRRSHNLGHDGFVALSRMPRLTGLSVSCKNVDDAAVATLPAFPSLRQLMPMDIPDDGYRHIGKCTKLEALLLMYCRDTSDRATEHIGHLRKLTRYFASYTQITDRTPVILSDIDSLETITFDGCAGLTNTGVAVLARLPKLRELRISGQGLTPDAAKPFGAGVEVHYSL